MRIGINGYYLTTPYSGIGQYSRNLLSSLGDIDKTNHYFIFVPRKIDFILPPNFTIKVVKPLIFLQKTFINRFLWEEYQLGGAIKKHKIEVFHGLYQSLPKGSEKIGNIVTIHDASPWRFAFEKKDIIYRWYNNKRKNLVKKRAKKVTTISETSKLDVAPIYDIKPEEIEVTYESVNPVFLHQPTQAEVSDFKKKYNLTKPFILYVGGLKRHKNLRMLIKAFTILVKENKYDGNLIITGSIRNTMAVSSAIYTRVEDLETYAKLKGVSKQIIFLENLSSQDLSIFMHEAKCFVSISLFEGFGLPAVEALSSGTPAVLSNLGAYPEVADSAALFVYPYGPHRIASALNQVLSDKKIREELTSNGLKRSKFFDRINIAKRILEIYQESYDDYKINFQP